MKRRLAAILATLLMLSALGMHTVAASHVTPGETMPGNYQCPAGSTEIDPVASGTYALADGGSVLITVTQTAMGPVFSFVATGAIIDSVVVKGGPNYHTYIYPGGTASDDGLHAPLNASNGKWYGLSHLCLESSKKDDGGKK